MSRFLEDLTEATNSFLEEELSHESLKPVQRENLQDRLQAIVEKHMLPAHTIAGIPRRFSERLTKDLQADSFYSTLKKIIPPETLHQVVQQIPESEAPPSHKPGDACFAIYAHLLVVFYTKRPNDFQDRSSNQK